MPLLVSRHLLSGLKAQRPLFAPGSSRVTFALRMSQTKLPRLPPACKTTVQCAKVNEDKRSMRSSGAGRPHLADIFSAASTSVQAGACQTRTSVARA